MRARRLRTLTSGDLDMLLGQCDDCAQRLGDDRSWAAGAVERFGLCGVVAMDGERPQGWLLVSPALNLPAGHPLAGSPARSSDAAQLLAVHVAPDTRGIGIGAQLVQHASARLIGHVSAVDAMGGSLAGSCTLPPAGWLRHVGFAPLDAAPHIDGMLPMRLDLTRSVRWRPWLDRALDAVTAWAKPSNAWPEPSARASTGDRWQ